MTVLRNRMTVLRNRMTVTWCRFGESLFRKVLGRLWSILQYFGGCESILYYFDSISVYFVGFGLIPKILAWFGSVWVYIIKLCVYFVNISCCI